MPADAYESSSPPAVNGNSNANAMDPPDVTVNNVAVIPPISAQGPGNADSLVLDQLRLAREGLRRRQQWLEREMVDGEQRLRQSGQVFAANDLARDFARSQLSNR